MDITDLNPLFYLLAAALIVGVVWSLLRGAFKTAVAVAAVGAVTYGGLWLINGEPPFNPAGFIAWVQQLPDAIVEWVAQLREAITGE